MIKDKISYTDNIIESVNKHYTAGMTAQQSTSYKIHIIRDIGEEI